VSAIPQRHGEAGFLDNEYVRDAIFVAALLAAAYIGFLVMPNMLALLTRMISIMLLVLALDLVTGYAGVATLGHATLFGAGAYAAGIAASQYGVSDPLLMLAVGAAAGAIAGLVCGAIILRGRGLTQLVLSIAIVQLAHEAANKGSSITGGSDGLSGIAPDPLFGMFRFDLFGRTAFWFAVALVVLVVVALRVVMRSPFGMLCRGIKEDPVRIQSLGISVNGTLLRLYLISGVVAGLGGALSAISTRVVGLDSLSFDLSANALVMLVLGGVGNLAGAVVGTVIFVLFENQVSVISPFHWLILVGLLLVAVVLFAPSGVTGLFARLFAARRRP
jgi:branched-chain amino acid transport system permease protein